MLPRQTVIRGKRKIPFAGQLRTAESRLISRKINALELQPGINAVHIADNLAVALIRRPDDKLGRTFHSGMIRAGGGLRRHQFKRGDNVAVIVFVRREFGEPVTSGRFDVQRNRTCQTQCIPDRRVRSAGNDFQMNITTITVFVTQQRGGIRQQLHRVIRRTDNSRTQENSEQPLFFQIFHKQRCRLVGSQRTAAGRIAVRPERTIPAIAGTGIGQQSFQHDSVSAPRKRNRIEPTTVQSPPAVLLRRGGTGAGKIVLRIFGKDMQFFKRIHGTPRILILPPSAPVTARTGGFRPIIAGRRRKRLPLSARRCRCISRHFMSVFL